MRQRKEHFAFGLQTDSIALLYMHVLKWPMIPHQLSATEHMTLRFNHLHHVREGAPVGIGARFGTITLPGAGERRGIRVLGGQGAARSLIRGSRLPRKPAHAEHPGRDCALQAAEKP